MRGKSGGAVCALALLIAFGANAASPAPTAQGAPGAAPAATPQIITPGPPLPGTPDYAGITPPVPANEHGAGIDDYPLISKALYEQGSTTLQFVVKEDGTVGDVRVTQSSGYQRLDDASVAVVKQRWLYKPAMKDGKPIAVRTDARITWKLESSQFTMPPDAPAIVMQMDPADYPSEAKANKEQGVVGILLVVNEQGVVMYAYVMRSSGYPELDKASFDIATNHWKVTPAQIGGKPVRTVIVAMMVWTLPAAAK